MATVQVVVKNGHEAINVTPLEHKKALDWLLSLDVKNDNGKYIPMMKFIQGDIDAAKPITLSNLARFAAFYHKLNTETVPLTGRKFKEEK